MLPSDLVEVLFLKLRVGESNRLSHDHHEDGTPCSLGKDPCMVVTKTTDGLQYKCHRCEEGGFERINTLSPEATAKAWKRVIEEPPEASQETAYQEELVLPPDCVPFITTDGKWNSKNVPWNAIHWLWGVGLMTPEDIDFEVLWSNSERRVIFPIYENGELVQWVGRDVSGDLSKYKNQKQAGINKRMFYTCEGDNRVVFTEDILSAIKVNKASGATTKALLTTHVTLSVLAPHKSRPMFLWLDGDMLAKSAKLVARFCRLGMAVRSIRTELDPKEYTPEEIKGYLK